MIELWAFVSVVVFTLVLYSRLRPAEPRSAIAARVAVAAAAVAIAIKLGSFPATYALYTSPVQLDPGLARTLSVIGDFSFVVSMSVMALSLGGSACPGFFTAGSHAGLPQRPE